MSLLAPLPPNFDAALRDVESKKAEFRLAAAKSLGRPPEAELDAAASALCQLLDDELAPVREAAVESLGRLGQLRSLDAIAALLDDPHRGVRQAAALALGDIGGPGASSRLVEACEDAHPEVRFSAIVGLSLIGDPEGAEAILPRLDDPDPEVRAISADALGELGAAAARDAIASLLDDDAPEPSRSAALALAKLGDSRAIPRLRALLAERDWAFDAALALGELRAEEAREDLAYIAGRLFGGLILKAAAAASLHELGDPRGALGLRAVLRAFRPDGRNYAVERVGRLRIVELSPELVALTRRPRGVDPVVLARALTRLADMRDDAKGALRRLSEQRGARGEAVRQALASAGQELP